MDDIDKHLENVMKTSADAPSDLCKANNVCNIIEDRLCEEPRHQLPKPINPHIAQIDPSEIFKRHVASLEAQFDLIISSDVKRGIGNGKDTASNALSRAPWSVELAANEMESITIGNTPSSVPDLLSNLKSEIDAIVNGSECCMDELMAYEPHFPARRVVQRTSPNEDQGSSEKSTTCSEPSDDARRGTLSKKDTDAHAILQAPISLELASDQMESITVGDSPSSMPDPLSNLMSKVNTIVNGSECYMDELMAYNPLSPARRVVQRTSANEDEGSCEKSSTFSEPSTLVDLQDSKRLAGFDKTSNDNEMEEAYHIKGEGWFAVADVDKLLQGILSS